jgi:MtfA peptidase
MISVNEIYNVLLLEFPFFKKINEQKRKVLCQRAKEFIDGTKFIPKKGMELTSRMKILIAACSQQLTLGFKKYYEYAYFDRVIVYPEKYLSTITGRYHTGEMNTIGAIVLSWDDFYKGISNETDAHNVGLHEFAHALEFMDISNQEIDEEFSACLDKFTSLADHYLHSQPEKPLFRAYATTNLSEFFAVATEYYFEAPDAFARQEPELFIILSRAFKQDTRSTIKTKKNIPVKSEEVFGSYIPFLNYFGEVSLYIIVIIFSVLMAALLPVVGAVFLVGGFYLMFTYLFKDSFTLHDDYVKIHQPLIKQIAKKIQPNMYKYETNIDYADVLYVSAQEFDFNTERNMLEELKEGYWFTLCYYQGGKIYYAKQSTNDKDCDSILRFLYAEKKVGTRLNGNYKKYR